ncbi:SYS [Hepatospora eriocheir]|uniref:SYS n=1 Tax=Hepatospora eriocheir TaxID=1081669 RepID=A0A1X0QG90_9MICR|nr:SYS [Hepatospora eriocheir]
MLNATLCAVQRSLCCIVENYQNDDGTITVPKVLRKFLNFDKFLFLFENFCTNWNKFFISVRIFSKQRKL